VPDMAKGVSHVFNFIKTAKSDTTLVLPAGVNADGAYLITALGEPSSAPVVTEINHAAVWGQLHAVTK
jgi:hypothetical protein